MRPGTPGFIGARLKEVREARGMSAISLADILGISRQAVSQYENAAQTPAPHVMRRISEILNVPTHFFLLPPQDFDGGAIFYRSMATATKGVRISAERRFGWLRSIVAYLRGFLKFPAVNLPKFDLPADPRELSDQDIERIASDTRRFWGLKDGPISNVAWLIENNGVVLSRFDLGAEKLDALSQWSESDGTSYIVLGSDKASAARSRFDVAHELGHTLMHRHISQDLLNNTKIFPWIEEQAHRFAGALLLPEKTFSADLYYNPSLDLFRSLKSKWNVSIALMIKRAADLKIVSTDQERRLWINYSCKGWRRNEPLDDVLEPEQPRLLRRSIELLIDKRILPPSEIPFRLALSPDDIEKLAGLPRGFFSERSNSSDILPVRTMGSDDQEEPDSENLNIIRFPRAL